MGDRLDKEKSQYVLFSLPQPALLTHSLTQFHPHLQNLMVDTNNASPNTSSRTWATSLIREGPVCIFLYPSTSVTHIDQKFSSNHGSGPDHGSTTSTHPYPTHTHSYPHPLACAPSCMHPQFVRTPSCTHTNPLVRTPTHNLSFLNLTVLLQIHSLLPSLG
jgi:hypothetical protein